MTEKSSLNGNMNKSKVKHQNILFINITPRSKNLDGSSLHSAKMFNVTINCTGSLGMKNEVFPVQAVWS